MNGWIKLHRSIEEWDMYFEEPFTRSSAWIDLLLIANHKEGTLIIRGNIIKINRGQVGWSEESLAKRWKWSRGKVRRYLIYLKTVQQIEQQKMATITLITIINYESYQQNGTADSTTDGQQTVQQTDTNKNDKKEKNDKNIPPTPQRVERVKFQKPSIADIRIYADSIDFEDLDPYSFFDFYESKGWMIGKSPMKDWKSAIRTWKRGRTKTETKPALSKFEKAKKEALDRGEIFQY